MCNITFYKTQKDVAKYLNAFIDAYWDGEVKESEFVHALVCTIDNNREKIFKDDGFTKIIEQRCGVRRVELLKKIIENSDKQKTEV